jgi:hypothetical protein
MMPRDVLIASQPLRPDAELRVNLRPYRGQKYVDVRLWHLRDGRWQPGGGLYFRHHLLPWIREALETAEQTAPEIR